MANHKRNRTKKQRAGCLLCKPWKMNGVNNEKISIQKQMDEEEDIEEEIDYNKDYPFYPFFELSDDED